MRMDGRWKARSESRGTVVSSPMIREEAHFLSALSSC